jgi:DNA-directed RNA polymerase specialized sigma24 family protein
VAAGAAGAEPPDRPGPGAGPDDRLDLDAALGRLPRTQRAVLVLRCWCDLDVRDTAAALGISEAP